MPGSQQLETGQPPEAIGLDHFDGKNARQSIIIEDNGSDDGNYESEIYPDDTNISDRTGHSLVRGRWEAMRMALLTFNSVGMTFAMGIEMTYFTPYLLSLGLSKGQTSLVWLASPLSGLVVQPIVGALSDRLRSKWGRRRPIILAGSVIASCSLLTLGFAKEIIGVAIKDADAAKIPSVVLAVLALYTNDFAVSAMMSCSRSLVVDTLPAEKQQVATAWANRMSSIGQMGGYAIGTVDLVKVFGSTLGDTQFKKLMLIASFGMPITSAITCWAVTERVFAPASQNSQKAGRFAIFRQIWSTLRALPPRIQAICWAVFWSMIGWFPFLFYNSTWIGELYYRYEVPETASNNTKDALGDMGRIGSMALTIYSIVTFASAWTLPLLINSPDGGKFNALKPDLLTAWLIGILVFAAAMLLAPFVASFRVATALVAVCGLPFTVSMWAPSALLGVEINRLSGANDHGRGSYRRLSTDSEFEMRDGSAPPASLEEGTETTPHGHHGGSQGGKLSGIYFGIFNIYMTVPQFIGTLLSFVVFAVLEPGKSPELSMDMDMGMDMDMDMGGGSRRRHGMEEGTSRENKAGGPNAIAVCLFIGALSSLVAAYTVRKLRVIS